MGFTPYPETTAETTVLPNSVLTNATAKSESDLKTKSGKNPETKGTLNPGGENRKEVTIQAIDIVDPLTAKATPIRGLGAKWKFQMDLLFPDYEDELTQKEHGQLKALTRVEGRKYKEILTYSMDHWQKFGQKARLTGGLSQYPTVPDVAFLLKHHHVAQAMLLQLIAQDETEATSVVLVSAIP